MTEPAPSTLSDRTPGDAARVGASASGPMMPRPAAVASLFVDTTQLPGWQFHVLGEIDNFDALRRHLGTARSDLLVDDVARRIRALGADLRVGSSGRRQVEIRFAGHRQDDLDQRLDLVRAACTAPFDLDGETHVIDLAFGAAAAPSDRADDVRMVEEAEAALREAQTLARAVTHDLGLPTPGEVRRIAIELDRAIREDELLLQYQPKVHVRRQEIASAEALVRWRHPQRGMIMPSDFIPVAEQTNLIGPMTLWTIRQAIGDQRRLATRGHDLRIFINISGQLLADTAFVHEACRMVAESDARLGFEITETSVIRDPESAIGNLQIFADIGIVIAIDDYGAGLSSLAYLKQLPARELKIDKLFVTQLTSSNRDPLIVRSTIDLAHALDMEVVAEGVETHSALALLTVMGCDMVQGFLISRPVGLDALMTFLEEDRAPAAPVDVRAALVGRVGAWKRV